MFDVCLLEAQDDGMAADAKIIDAGMMANEESLEEIV